MTPLGIIYSIKGSIVPIEDCIVGILARVNGIRPLLIEFAEGFPNIANPVVTAIKPFISFDFYNLVLPTASGAISSIAR